MVVVFSSRPISPTFLTTPLPPLEIIFSEETQNLGNSNSNSKFLWSVLRWHHIQNIDQKNDMCKIQKYQKAKHRKTKA